jgi:hypothetical protein
MLVFEEPADDIAGIVKQEEDRSPLNSSHAEEDARIGLDEVGEQAEEQVGDHEKLEDVAGEERRSSGFGVRAGILRLRIIFASRS